MLFWADLHPGSGNDDDDDDDDDRDDDAQEDCDADDAPHPFCLQNFFDMQASAKKRDTSRLRDAGKRLRHLEEVLGNVGTEVNSFLKDMKRKAAVRSAAGRGSAHKKDSTVAAEAAGDLTFRTCDSGSSLHPAERPPLAASAEMLGWQKSANVVTLPSLGFRALKQGPMDPENDIPIGARSIDELQR